ncbi:hypothetical protein OAQ80_00380 [Flavobacteriaceae bacterium]|nr:hypothetical protein [Flavobacteriaceae bacterium]
MNINDIPKIIDSISSLANWSKTTFIRTFYKLKPHLIQKKVEKLFQHPNVDAVYVTSEIDNPKMNHLHLAIAGRKLTREQIADSMEIKTEAVGNIEIIKGKKQTLQYISKQLIRQNRYIDAYHDLFINPKH